MESKYLKMLDSIDAKIQKLRSQAAEVRWFYENGDADESYKRAFKLEDTAEKFVFLTRELPAYTGRPSAKSDTEEAITQSVPVGIGFTAEGWFCLRMPAILPKKEKTKTDYIRPFLYPAMRKFFSGKEPVRYGQCVIIYRHVYDRNRPERQMRDHDNYEINMVTDIVAMYTMPDDGPKICSHLYCTAQGSEDRTEVYVVPRLDLIRWIENESAIPDEGVILYEMP